MKKFFLLSIIALIIITIPLNYSENNNPESIDIFYNNKKINFNKNEPFLDEKNVLMVPIETLIDSFNSHVTTIKPDKETIIIYKNNNFIKLKLNEPKIYVNGLEKDLISSPISKNNTIYLPIEHIVKEVDMSLSWNENNTTLNIKNNYKNNPYSFISDTFFKKYHLKPEGIEFSLPNSWKKISDRKYTYSLYEGFETYGINIYTQKLDKISLNSYINNIKKDYSSKYSFSKILNLNINGINYKILSTINKKDSLINENNETNPTGQPNFNKKIFYFFSYNDTAYNFEFSYAGEASTKQSINLINTIMNSLKISKLTVDQNSEHYIEYNNFFKSNFNLTSKIHSNKAINNFINFEGSIDSNNIKSIKVIIEKDKNKRITTIPINNQKFKSNIYTPFGLGKHNVTIALNNNTKENYNNESILNLNSSYSNAIMQFSLVNLNDKQLLYLLPSEKINSKSNKIESAAKVITIDHNNSYDKSKELYHWIFENIELKNNSANNKNSIEVFDTSSGNNLEINLLYCSFLRSLNIPSKIIKRINNENQIIFQTEIYINGEWIITDLGSEISNHISDDYSTFEYFNIYDKNYFDQFKIEEKDPNINYVEILNK